MIWCEGDRKPMNKRVIKIKGNYLRTVSLKRLSFTYLSRYCITHPSIYSPVLSSMHRPFYSSSVYPSISCGINPPIHPPAKSRQVIHWSHYTSSHGNKNGTLLTEDSRGKIKLWRQRQQCSDGAETTRGIGVGGVREEGQGGSKCQVPLGSEDGGYIYQSKQPRGAEYFTCRCGLLHYHIHQSHGVPFQPLTIQNSYNML